MLQFPQDACLILFVTGHVADMPSLCLTAIEHKDSVSITHLSLKEKNEMVFSSLASNCVREIS